MKRRRASISSIVLYILFFLGIYYFFVYEESFEPYYYVEDASKIFYKAKRNDKYHYSYTFAGLDTPIGANKPFANEAKNFIDLAIKSGDIHIERAGGEYFYIWLGTPADSSDATIRKQMLNALMISNGYSKYNPSKNQGEIAPEYEKTFLALQKEAQDKNIGIWTLPENSPEARAKIEAERIRQQEEARKAELARQAQKKKEQQEYLERANIVVITPKGKRYHYRTCRTVRNSYREITIKQARKRGYTPCQVCDPPSREVTLENSNIYWGDDVYKKN